jgi:hypothetical protein
MYGRSCSTSKKTKNNKLMWCVIWKKDDIYSIFTNQIFESNKKALEFKNKQTSFRKKHDAKVVPYDYKYFKGVKEHELDK